MDQIKTGKVKLLSHGDVENLRKEKREQAIEAIIAALDGFPISEAEEITSKAISLIRTYAPLYLTHCSGPLPE